MGYQNFFATKLYTDIGASDTTITLDQAPTETSGRLVLEARNPTQREIIKYSGVSGNQITGVLRGQGGTTAKTHVKGSLVEMNVTAEDLDDAIGVPNDIITRFDEVIADHANSGMVWSQVALLTGAMTSGILYLNGYRVAVSAVASYAFPASKDIYVDVDVTGTLYYTPVANGATSGFALSANRVRLAKVVTNASTITSITQSGYDVLNNRIYPNSPVGIAQAPTLFYEELSRVKLTAVSDLITLTFPPRRNLKLLFNFIASGGAPAVNTLMRFNGDAGANYSQSFNRFDGNGSTNDLSITGLNMLLTNMNNTDVAQGMAVIDNDPTRAKMMILDSHFTGQTASAYSVPIRFWGHWNSAAQITKVEISNLIGSGDLGITTEAIMLGHD